MSKKTKSAIAFSILLFATVYATAVLVYWGSAPYFGYDELWHTALAAVSPPWMSLLLISADVHPPLHYLLLRPLTRIGGDPFFPRLMSIVPSILSIPLWYLLLRKMRISTAPALLTTVILAFSFAFHDVGITIRSYSLTMLLLLGAIWFWIDLLPGGRGTASRWSAVLSLALFTAAFWSLYVAALVTAAVMGATLLAALGNSGSRQATLANWRRYSGRPEWLAFFAFHLLAVLWMWWGRHQHGSGGLTNHINMFLPTTDQGTFDYLINGLRQEISLFSPLSMVGQPYIDIGLSALLILVLWVSIHNIRDGRTIAAVFTLVPLLLTALLALAGLLSFYPFGGSMRHQYILYPFLLLLLPLSLDLFWRSLHYPALKGILLTAVLAIALYSTANTHEEHFSIGDAPPSPFWKDEFDTLFSHGSDSIVVTPAYGSYATFMNRWIPGVHYRTSFYCDADSCKTAPQGFPAIVKPWPDFQLFAAYADDGGDAQFLRYRGTMLPTLPGGDFLDALRNVLKTLGKTRARLFSPETNHQPNPDRAELAQLLAKHGLTLTRFEPVNTSILWSVELANQVNSSTAAPSMTTNTPTKSEHQEQSP